MIIRKEGLINIIVYDYFRWYNQPTNVPPKLEVDIKSKVSRIHLYSLSHLFPHLLFVYI